MPKPNDPTTKPAAGTEVAPWQRPPFAPGHELSMRHGAYSVKRIGERARTVASDVLDLAPHLDDPAWSLAVTEYAMARGRLELLTVAIENHLTTQPIAKLSPRLVESATAASREAAAQRASLGLDPRSLAELQTIKSMAALNMAQIAAQAPQVLEAIQGALEAIGLADRAEEFSHALAVQLLEVTGDD